MATQDQAKQAVAKAQTTDIHTLIQRSVNELGKALPSHMSPERLVRIALTTLRLNPKLYQCTPASFLGALFQSAQLGLEPNIEGQAYIIPFNNKQKNGSFKMEAQFQVGYKGYAELFYRHQSSVSIDMQEVRANDDFDYSLGTESFLKHKPALKDRGDVFGYYAVALLKDGGRVFKFMSKDECMTHGRKYSKCYSQKESRFYQYTPWSTNPDAMCRKTVLIQLMKLLPKSIEIQRATAMDETIKANVDKDMFAIPDKTDWNAEESAPAEITQEAPKAKDAPVKGIVDSDLQELLDYLKSSDNKVIFEERLNECRPTIAGMMGDAKAILNGEVNILKAKYQKK